MSLSMLGWLFALGVVAHNVEEALFLPAWSARAGRWHVRVEPTVFRFAVAVLSAAVVLAAWLASLEGPRSFGAYFIAGYAAAMVLNVVVPHVAASVALRSYAPGTASALMFNLPLGCCLVYRSLAEEYVEPPVFAIVGPGIVLAIGAAIPLLFAVGRRLIKRPV